MNGFDKALVIAALGLTLGAFSAAEAGAADPKACNESCDRKASECLDGCETKFKEDKPRVECKLNCTVERQKCEAACSNP